MTVADNMDRHKISEELEFQQDQTVHFGVTCPRVPKKTHFQLCLEHSLCNFYPIFMKLADKKNRSKIFNNIENWATSYYLRSCMPLIAGMLGHRRASVAPVGNLFPL